MVKTIESHANASTPMHLIRQCPPFLSLCNDCDVNVTCNIAAICLCRVDVKFDAVLLDPPRDGLDDFTRSKIHQFKVVMLISCNPRHKLLLDIQTLLPTHDLKRYVVLDHFPGTSHLECAAVLVKR
eukprot:TRINITY_DN8615_c0_g1_i1.p2 TRINITY_DN8615_c0_g1~~TRINITY_DN8615_c0_g1_i1.p2  ORF type:complete len:126 (+),score=21.39 TRINITY_DN8615_c0_g1_i1:1095-1472(+)